MNIRQRTGPWQRARRRAMAGWICVVLGAGTMTTGCDSRADNEYATPEAAMHAMFTAFRRARVEPDRAWAFLGPETRARLEDLAKAGPPQLEPMDYIRFGWLPDPALVRSVQRTDTGGRTAILRVETELNDTFELQLVREERGWQIELGGVDVTRPTPPSDVPSMPDEVAP